MTAAYRTPLARPIGPLRAVAWVVATVVGLAVGGFAFHFPGGGDPVWDPSALVFGTLLGGVTGLLVGLLQWAVLRGFVARAGRIPWAMAVAIGATHGWYDGSPATGMGLIAPVSAGIAAAIAFALVLGERRGAVVIAIVTGWALGLVLGNLTTNAIGMPWWESSAGFGPAALGTDCRCVVDGAPRLRRDYRRRLRSDRRSRRDPRHGPRTEARGSHRPRMNPWWPGQPPAGPRPSPGSVIDAGSRSSSSRPTAIPRSMARSRIVRPVLSASLARSVAAS